MPRPRYEPQRDFFWRALPQPIEAEIVTVPAPVYEPVQTQAVQDATVAALEAALKDKR